MTPSKPPKTLAEMAAETARVEGGTRGIACPKCGCRHFEVIKTKPHDGEISRRKQCRNCKQRVTTMETLI